MLELPKIMPKMTRNMMGRIMAKKALAGLRQKVSCS
jgi:hypothetical protein